MNQMTPITRSLLLANVVCYLLQLVCKGIGIDLTESLGLHFILASHFGLYQLVTYMFLHGSLTHLFFNMFSLWMFGSLIERTLGRNRFLIYYMVCGIGAGLCQELWQAGQYFMEGMPAYDYIQAGYGLMPMGDYLNLWTTIGASGACYGVLLAFGMLFPNERIMLLIPPIPMKAKYFVIAYAAIELFSAYSSNDNVAHFAHLGGMLFGWLSLRYWRRREHTARHVYGGWADTQPATPTLGQRLQRWWDGLRPTPRRTKPGNARHTATRQDDYDYNLRQRQKQERMDRILDKIRTSGYSSLTTEEKNELFRLSHD